MSKRSIASFFTKAPASDQSTSKRVRISSPPREEEPGPPTIHESYPHPISSLPSSLLTLLDAYERQPPRHIKKPDLDVDFYQPFFPPSSAKPLYLFLRKYLPFYRVTYTIKRNDLETTVKTPRFTTVYGVDSHSYFSGSGGDDENRILLDSKTHRQIPPDRYKSCVCRPRPIPQCLEVLKNIVERETGDVFNFILVNYYASSDDSISYPDSDDEQFLGPNPTIASMSLGTTRDFLMKHKNDKNQTLKLPLTNGELLVMKGTTQKKWLHSIPKRSATISGSWTNGGRINITFRNGVEMACTGNYYRYNVGSGPVYRWDDTRSEMVIYEPASRESESESAKAEAKVEGET
ncbi:hypothetical protein H072_7648 [Dactylellina haptotyla CBS 200.50]|uniref:Fe2OG dioxygenase domain-containing protein n=1 Tax=Dactylellina haptotyla (strain CBS 200.50) TaxID=1284197 RepID=S8A6S2_DACHA|nr:hypothetical protein H072_7648 [Dactylellina haptotyla CBS 200.50]